MSCTDQSSQTLLVPCEEVTSRWSGSGVVYTLMINERMQLLARAHPSGGGADNAAETPNQNPETQEAFISARARCLIIRCARRVLRSYGNTS